MTYVNLVPQRSDLAVWRGDVAAFLVMFTDAAGAALDVSGVWEATFEQDGGEMLVDDTDAATGTLVVRVVETDGLDPVCSWVLRRTDLDVTYLQGEVRISER